MVDMLVVQFILSMKSIRSLFNLVSVCICASDESTALVNAYFNLISRMFFVATYVNNDLLKRSKKLELMQNICCRPNYAYFLKMRGCSNMIYLWNRHR